MRRPLAEPRRATIVAPHIMKKHTSIALALSLTLVGCGGSPDAEPTEAPEPSAGSEAEASALALPNQREPEEGITTGGQPTDDDLRAAAAAGVTTIVTLRRAEEPGFEEERALVEELGMRFVSVPVAGAEGLTAENASRVSETLETADGPTVVHCGSGNRVGAIFAIRAWQAGRSIDEAMQVGRDAGLTSLEDAVRARLGELCAADAERDC